MSQNRQSLGIVAKSSGLAGRLVRPLCAKLLEPTIPELEGKLRRESLLDISGRSRERQIALAAEFGIVDYPSPAGGCKLTEEGYGRKLRDLMEHEGLGNRRLVELLNCARRFRLPGGTGVILGRDRNDNAVLKAEGALGTVVSPVNCPGPTALLPYVKCESDMGLALELVCSYSRCDRLPEDVTLKVSPPDRAMSLVPVPRPYDRGKFKDFQIC